MARKRRKRSRLYTLTRKADRALSEYIRTEALKLYGNKCPLCNKKGIQCCFHIISRRRKILRWDCRNTIGACHTCNWLERYYPDLSRAWFIKQRGVAFYLALVEESQKDFEPTVEYLEQIITTYQNKLKELKDGK